MIITNEIKLLVKKIEHLGNLQANFPQLIQLLAHSCENNRLKSQHSSLTPAKNFHSTYPLENGYAQSFDILEQEQELLQAWHQYGFVVGKQVVNYDMCDNAVDTILSLCQHLDMNLDQEVTWKKDNNGQSILSRGFFELYHDDSLAQIRQSLRLYLHHVVLWESPFLWTSFDRLGLKLPQDEQSRALPLHVDQNPMVHNTFKTIQGVLALKDCPLNVGTFVGVPGSCQFFHEYSSFIDDNYKGEYIELPKDSQLYSLISDKAQAIPIRKGDIVSWDSRTTHANSSNMSQQNRYVAYISTGLAKDEQDLITTRKNYFMSGEGINVREAYLHASKKPRFNDVQLLGKLRKKEQLNSLGLCLYGLKQYKDYL